MELVNLAEDPAETTNLAGDFPGKVQELRQAFDAWLAPLPEPITGGPKRLDGPTASASETVAAELSPREVERAKIRAERRATAKAAKGREQAEQATGR